jgi:hypothetical protein
MSVHYGTFRIHCQFKKPKTGKNDKKPHRYKNESISKIILHIKAFADSFCIKQHGFKATVSQENGQTNFLKTPRGLMGSQLRPLPLHSIFK